ncbi:MAG: dihydroorotase [Bacteroidetes bacterium]|nr:MAG: dihydroorotase [Bacteroidota bacterium]
MSVVVFRSVTIVDPQSSHHLRQADVAVGEGYIQQIGPPGSLPAAGREVNIAGACLSPGWVDMHVQLNEPGYEWKERMDELAEAARLGGFTAVLCYPNTLPPVDHRQMVEALSRKASLYPVDLWFTGSLSQGVKGKELAELYDMATAGALAFTDGSHPLEHTGLLLRAMQYLQAFEGLMIHYPGDSTLSGQGQMNEGETSTRLGMPGIPELAESVGLAKVTELLKYAGGRLHLQPLTAPSAMQQLAAARRQFPTLSTGTDVMYLSLDDSLLEQYDTHYKVMPPLRSKAQQEQLKKALQEGLIDTLSSGHSAQSQEEKNMEFSLAEPGMLGLQTAYSLANMQLVQKNIIDQGRLIEMMSINPRKILQKAPVSVQEGQKANLTLFHPHAEWELQAGSLPGRSRNSPLLNQRLRGKVLGIYHKELLHLATD